MQNYFENAKIQTTLKAADDLSRELPVSGTAGEPKKNRQVGLFYFTWLGEHDYNDGDRTRFAPPLDVTKILAANPRAGYDPSSGVWGGVGVMHHWGEPLFGYYHSRDEWVMRRHVEMLTHADIDFLILDATNTLIYEENAKMLLRLTDFYRDEGWNTPKVAFYTNTRSGETVQKLYKAIYEPGYMANSWYRLEGKPLVIADAADCSPEMRSFFTIRESQWPNEPAKASGGWPWMDFECPQRVFCDADGNPEIINVSVAQHPQIFHGDSAMYGETANRGRSYHGGRADLFDKSYIYGFNFAEQWERAIECDTPFVFVTGWNEWIMGRWAGSRPERPIGFVDCANVEYSRDCEPMKGGYFDNYYMQLIFYVRKYKGVKPITEAAEMTIDISGDFSVWDAVETEYRDFSNGACPRHCSGYGGIYEDDTGNNEIILSKCAHDETNIYFYAKASKDITDPLYAGGTWLNLYLKVNTDERENAKTGYDYIANYFPFSKNMTSLAEFADGGFEIMSDLEYKCAGSEFMICVPKGKIGLDGKGSFELEFKWADAKTRFLSAEDFYTKGDCAPIGRLNFVFKA
ncbi:MAG: hypothetical protein FWD23_07375 [Oscillospiraceae bacterium]|nr:hypothetical protein [Oscillospiraceae bacterium]